MGALLGQDGTKRGQERGHGRPNVALPGAFDLHSVFNDDDGLPNRYPHGLSCPGDAPRLLRGRFREVKTRLREAK